MKKEFSVLQRAAALLAALCLLAGLALPVCAEGTDDALSAQNVETMQQQPLGRRLDGGHDGRQCAGLRPPDAAHPARGRAAVRRTWAQLVALQSTCFFSVSMFQTSGSPFCFFVR